MRRSKKFPSFSQWKQIFNVLGKSEKIALTTFILLSAISFIFLATNFYINNTKIAPAFGGKYIEGVVGQPRFINPIYGETNDVDRSLIDLIYSGLMAYDKDGKITNDLAESYNISDDGKTYEFTLKDNIFWQDGEPLTSDDIIFTIKTIQNSDYKSPLRANWIGIDVQKTSQKSVIFILRSPYNSFLETCTVKIIPQHVWSNIIPENFGISTYNLQPIGSGPYSFSEISQADTGFIKSIDLKSNYKYFGNTPYISSISFQFFADKEGLVKAINAKKIDGFSLSPLDNDQALAEKEIRQGWSSSEKFSVYSMLLPRYFAVFLNTNKGKLFSDPNIRQALNYSINKEDLIKQISESTKNNTYIVDSPILPDYYGFETPSYTYTYDADTANSLLDKSGFKNQENGQRAKPNNKKPAFQFKNYIASGTKSSDVTQLQACLARLDENFKNLMHNETNGTYGKGTEDAVTEFQKKYMPEEKPTGEVGKATRVKLNELCTVQQADAIPLKFTLITLNQPRLIKVADILKNYWQNVGISIDIKFVEISELKSIIKTRDFDALLYGEALSSEPDIFPFWHSTQINDPGLNLSAYQNKNVDQLLKESRETLDISTKQEDYEKIQDIIISDAPAIFLYNTDYIYWASGKVKGIDTNKIIDPAKRFSNIQNWYIRTHRVWK